MPTLAARTVLASVSLVSVAALAQPADAVRGQSLWARTNDAALILKAIGAVRTGMAFLAPHVSERDAIDIAAFLGEAARKRAAGATTAPGESAPAFVLPGLDGGAVSLGRVAALAQRGIQRIVVPRLSPHRRGPAHASPSPRPATSCRCRRASRAPTAC